MRSLRASLLDEPLPRIMAIAEAWDVALEAASLTEMADALAAAMRENDIDGTPAALRVRAELPADAAAALNELLEANGKMPSAAFERRFGEIRLMGPARIERERPWRTPANASEVLWYRGFVFRAFDGSAHNPLEHLFVPNELRDLLRPRTPTPAGPAAGTTARPAAIAEHADSPLLDDMVSLLIAVQGGHVRVTREGAWTVDARRTLRPLLRDDDGLRGERPTGRFSLLCALLTDLGWARVQDGTLRLIAQPVTDWLQLPAVRQRALLFAAWRDSVTWNDLWHVEGLRFEMTHTWSNEPLRERTDALRLLAEAAGPAEWTTLLRDLRTGTPGPQPAPARAAALIAAIKRDHPDFLQPDGRYDRWHLRDAHSGAFLQGFERWDRVEGAYLWSLLLGPLRWLEADALDAVERPEPEPALILGEGAELIALPEARFARFQLARIARPGPRRADGGWSFRLTPASRAMAARLGISAGRVIAFLEQGLGAALPQGLNKALARAVERGAEARAETALLLRTRESTTLDTVMRLDVARRLSIERLGPTVAACRPGDLDALLNAAAAQGLLIDLSS
ncbi:MAG: helicase-associated domain-containing protein [Thermoflexales bacterium]|nr:helicase-associated domain-containing protein [Thermoflexales bacterium]